MNAFEVLGLSIEELAGQNEATIAKRVDEAHKELYSKTMGAYANIPRSDGRTQQQWQSCLNDAKNTLLDPAKRRKHIAELTEPSAESSPPEELTEPSAESPPEELTEPSSESSPTGTESNLQTQLLLGSVGGIIVVSLLGLASVILLAVVGCAAYMAVIWYRRGGKGVQQEWHKVVQFKQPLKEVAAEIWANRTHRIIAISILVLFVLMAC